MITDTPFFAMEKIHDKLNNGYQNRLFLDNKRSSMKLQEVNNDYNFSNAIQKLDKNKIKQLKNRYASNIIILSSNPENSPNAERGDNGGFSDIEVD